jgi:formate-dependent nitrite reductase cytochrome c552 subunit
VNNCGLCHSGDVFYRVNVRGETVPEDAFVGLTPDDLNPVVCAVCHDPHARTGNAAAPDTGRDFQLRFRQVASPTPSNAVEDVTNPQRFNLCGQCHHDRGRTWETNSRPPHHSNQSNVYVGEMPIPDPETQDPLVFNRVSVHSFATEQCATCHMYREDFQSEEAPAISGHNFTVNNAGCATSGCHPSTAAAIAAQTTLQDEVQSRLDNILERLGDPATWEYVANGGPVEADQVLLPVELRQARYLYYYALVDGSRGVHNPDYVRSILVKAELLLVSIGK